MKLLQLFFVLLFFLVFLRPGTCQDQEEEAKDQSGSYYEEEKPRFIDRVYFGGNLGLSFGSVTYIEVSPLAGYMFTPKFSGGLGGVYQYLSYNNINISSSTYGGRVFLRYNFIRQLFVHGEFEALNFEYFERISPPGSFSDIYRSAGREWVPSLFLGPGYLLPIGRKGGISLMVLYNVLYAQNRDRSPYNSPWAFRVGFIF